MDQKRKVLVIAAVFMLVAGGAAQARPAGDGQAGRMEKARLMQERHEAMVKELGLSDEQQQKIQQHRTDMKADRQAVRQALRDKRDKMRQALEQPELDMVLIQQIQGEIKALIIQREDDRLAGVLQMRQILTPEQFAQFHVKMKEQGRHHGEPAGGPRWREDRGE